MRRLVEATGVDFDQWRALTRAQLRMDFRVTRVPGAALATKAGDQQFSRFLSQAAMYLFLGFGVAITVFFVGDLMLSATLALTYVMTMVAVMVLVDHQSVITSPHDYLVLGSRPISSRTYFAARLANVLAYTLALTTLYGVFPMLAFGVAGGFRPLVFLAAVPAFYLSTTFVVLVLVFSYAGMLRIVGADRLSRVLSFLQVIIGIVLYAGYMMPGEAMRHHTALAMPASPWVFLYPPTWFASYLAIANGAFGVRQILPAAASVVALVLLLRGLGGRLSLDYAERLGAMASATAPAPPGARRRRQPWIFRSGERRVVSLLVRAQFRNDQKFRMSVLGVLPMTIVYMYLSFRDGPPADPFGGTASGMWNWTFLTLAVLFFPMMLRTSLAATDSYRASWIYFGTPVSRERILRAQTDVLMLSFVVPYLCMVAAAMAYFTGHLVSITTHVVFLGLAGRLLLQAVTASFPVMPFSRPPQRLGGGGSFMGWLFFATLAGGAIGPLLAVFVYVSPVRIALLAAILVAASVALDRLTRARVGADADQLEFFGVTLAGRSS